MASFWVSSESFQQAFAAHFYITSQWVITQQQADHALGIMKHEYNRSVLKKNKKKNPVGLLLLLLLLNMWPSPSEKHMEILIRSLKVLSFIWQSHFQMHSLFILRAAHLDTLYATEALITTQFFIYFSFHLHCQWSDTEREGEHGWPVFTRRSLEAQTLHPQEHFATWTEDHISLHAEFDLLKFYLVSRTLQHVHTQSCVPVRGHFVRLATNKNWNLPQELPLLLSATLM